MTEREIAEQVFIRLVSDTSDNALEIGEAVEAAIECAERWQKMIEGMYEEPTK